MTKGRGPRAALPAAVYALGLTSLLTDVGSEMILSLLPVFLVGSLGASPAFLGLVEGAADAVASVLKLVAGAWSDRLPRRKPLVVAGYALASATRPLFAFAATPLQVLALRLTDRVGKGIRTSPRDALLADSAPEGEAGRAFGVHRAMDHAGAVVGPLVASAMLLLGVPIRGVFLAATVPAAFSVLSLAFVREPERRVPVAAAGVAAAIPSRFRSLLAVLLVFTLGNATDALLLLRAHELGVAVAALPLLWSALHVTKLAATWLAGGWSDRYGRVPMLVAGWIAYALSYVLLGLATEAWHAWALLAAYGAYHGLTEPAERALVRDLVPAEARGRAYGAYHLVSGLGALPAGLLAGGLWEAYGAPVALFTGGAIAALAAVLLLVWNAGSRRGG